MVKTWFQNANPIFWSMLARGRGRKTDKIFSFHIHPTKAATNFRLFWKIRARGTWPCWGTGPQSFPSKSVRDTGLAFARSDSVSGKECRVCHESSTDTTLFEKRGGAAVASAHTRQIRKTNKPDDGKVPVKMPFQLPCRNAAWQRSWSFF